MAANLGMSLDEVIKAGAAGGGGGRNRDRGHKHKPAADTTNADGNDAAAAPAESKAPKQFFKKPSGAGGIPVGLAGGPGFGLVPPLQPAAMMPGVQQAFIAPALPVMAAGAGTGAPAAQVVGSAPAATDHLTTSMLLTAQQIATTMAMMGKRQPLLETAIQNFISQGGNAGANAAELSMLISSLASSAMAGGGAALQPTGAAGKAPPEFQKSGGGVERVNATAAGPAAPGGDKQRLAPKQLAASTPAQLLREQTELAVTANTGRRAALLAKARGSGATAATVADKATADAAPGVREAPKVRRIRGRTALLLKDRFDMVHGLKK